MVAGGDFGGEESAYSTHLLTEETGFTNSKAANQTTGAATGWKFVAFVSSALS